jgi:hypothetical protein
LSKKADEASQKTLCKFLKNKYETNKNYAGDKYLDGFKIEELLEIEMIVKLELYSDYKPAPAKT